MITQTVRADTGGREGKWVGLIILTILVFASLSIPYNQAKSSVKIVPEHQVLISDIEQENLAMIAELRLAHEEIRDLFMESTDALSDSHGASLEANASDLDKDTVVEAWPSIKQLESDWIAPFVKDQSWKRKGKHKWLDLGEGRYLGVPNKRTADSPFFLDSTHVAPQIWILKAGELNSAKSIIASSYQPERMIKRGWKQVIMNSEQDKHQH